MLSLANHITTLSNKFIFLNIKFKNSINVVQIHQSHRVLAWVIASFAFGAVAYNYLLIEPAEAWTISMIVLVLALLMLSLANKWNNMQNLLMVALMPVLVGFAYMQMTTMNIADNRPTENLTGTHQMTATIDNWHDRGNKHYLTLNITNLNNSTHNFKARIRIYDSQMPHEKINLGDEISVLARISPPKPAQVENGFSARRFFFLQDIHYSGFALGDMTITKAYDGKFSNIGDIKNAVHYKTFAFRELVAEKIRTHIKGDEGEVATALLTGLRGRISQESQDNMRYSGLAHLLAISGLHMACAALSVFFLMRLLLSCHSRLALHYPIKKISAVVALGTAFIYLLLSGDSISATRAWIMVTLGLVAILLDRRVFSMRIVAISAALILLFEPHQVTRVGFQLSYLAVIGLIAYYEWHSKKFKVHNNYNGSHGLVMAGVSYISKPIRVAAMTTLIAGFATTPAISHYFGYVAPWSMVSNLVAVPLTGLVIIPSGFIGLALMPLGLESLPLSVMGYGISHLLSVAEFVRSLPAGEWRPQHFSGLGYGLFVLGFLWLCLCQSRIRFYGVPLIVISFLMWGSVEKPLAIIQGGKRAIAVSIGDGGEGEYGIYGVKVGSYRVKRWVEHYGLGDVIPLDDGAGICDDVACRFGDKFRVIVSFERDFSEVHCSEADMVIAYYNRADFGECLERGVEVIRYNELKELGAMMIYGDGVRFAVKERERLWQR